MSRHPKSAAIEQHYSAKQIGERLGLTSDEVRKLFRPGAIWPVVRINARVIRASESAINGFLASKTWDTAPI